MQYARNPHLGRFLPRPPGDELTKDFDLGVNMGTIISILKGFSLIAALFWMSSAGPWWTTASSAEPASTAAQSAPQAPPVSGQVTFLYYQDLDRAAEFYGETLGLKTTLGLDWVKIFQLSPSSSVGLVNATGGTHRPSSDKPVMVSLVVEDVDGWYEYVKSRGVEVPNPPKDSARTGVRSFGFKDPEGYTLEVFAWLKK
jgi:predicted enzyme related to lactoylglutathione lyase